MRMHALLLFVALGCGGPSAKTSTISQPSGGPEKKTEQKGTGDDALNQDEADLQAVADRFVAAMLRGDKATMQKLTLTHAQMTSLSTKEIAKAEYDQDASEFFDGRVREAKEGQAKGPVAIVAKVAETKTFEPGEKLKVQLELAVVKLVVTETSSSGEPHTHDAPFPMIFVKVDGVWRYTFMK